MIIIATGGRWTAYGKNDNLRTFNNEDSVWRFAHEIGSVCTNKSMLFAGYFIYDMIEE
jgi:hypothetical protein